MFVFLFINLNTFIMSTQIANGTIRTVTVDLDQVRTIPYNNDAKPELKGKFGVVVTPHDENTAGIIAMTENQLLELAQQMSLSRWQTMARAMNRRDSKLQITYQFCKAGEAAIDNPEVVYTKDWWKRIDTVVFPGDLAYDYVDKVTSAADTKGEMAAEELNSKNAKELRRDLLRKRLSGNADPAAAGNPEPDPETAVDPTLEEEATATGGKGKTK